MFFVVMYKDHVVTQKMQAQRQIISLCPSPFTTLVRPHIVIGEIYFCMDCSCVQFNRLGACQTESLRLEIKKKFKKKRHSHEVQGETEVKKQLACFADAKTRGFFYESEISIVVL